MAEYRRATILVVDDVEHIRIVLRRQLTAEGHTVLEADDGAKALKLVRERQGQVDLVLADVVMLGMNGADLADRLAIEFPDLPVVLMSAFAPAGMVRAGMRDRIIPVLRKPFGTGQLDSVLRITLSSPTGPDDSAAGGSG
jgi:CheY-like chemotaxis protein